MTKKSIFSLLLLTASIVNIQAQDKFTPSIWEGKLMGLRLVLKIDEDATSKQPVAVFDSPDQGAFGLKVSKLNITDDSLSAFSSQINGGFKGAFNKDKTELVGAWNQGTAIPFVMKRVSQSSALKRPQTPVAPFPYTEEKLTYQNATNTVKYGATLTVPNVKDNVPVVILISGSGQQDRDATIFGHKPFLVIADYLSRNGIAVLRVDDRGIGETTGEVTSATSKDFAYDVLAGVAYLKSRQDLDSQKIGLIGHSEGGLIAPLVATLSKDIAFIVSLAGPGISGSEILRKQTNHLFKQQGLSEAEILTFQELQETLNKLSEKYSDNSELKPIFQETMKNWLANQSETTLFKLGFSGPNADKAINQMAAFYFLPWTRFFRAYNPAVTLAKIKIPFLALNGGKDTQVLAKENLAGFEQHLRIAGNKNFKTMAFPELNHLFQHAVTGEVGEYSTIEETFDPMVLETMVTWIKSLK